MEKIVWLDEVNRDSVESVGGKAASLGEMRRALKNFPVPDGFVVTAEAYRSFLESTGLDQQIRAVISTLAPSDVHSLAETGQKIRTLITSTALPPELEEDICQAYRTLVRESGSPAVVVRSSATAEDSTENSFAGQHDTYLNVKGERKVLDRVRGCFASLFTDRAISYRYDRGLADDEVALAVVVQHMVRSDLASSGVLFTIDPETGLDHVVYVTSAYGFGELVVQGKVNPDQFYVFKPGLAEGRRALLEKRLGSKHIKLVCSNGSLKEVPAVKQERQTFSLTDDEVLQLARWGTKIEDHYRQPMDIEWAKDGVTGRLYIVQARPETIHGTKSASIMETFVLEETGEPLASGEPVGSKIGQGTAHIILDAKEIDQFHSGEVLITEMTDPDWEPIMKIASAIVTERGGRTCHAAIISRELGIPCVIGAERATQKIATDQPVTVDCSQGQGRVLRGLLKFRRDRLDVQQLPRTRTKIMMNVGIPEMAFVQSRIPNDGVGLAREEFIIGSHIGIHPQALLEYESLKARATVDTNIAEIVQQIDQRTEGYRDKTEFFIDKLAAGVSKIAAAFWPNDVIVRLSDFKSNEYASLIGGALYEPTESNPMIGWRGASRYYDPRYKAAFGLECETIKKVRDELGVTNVKVMIPFCRTLDEGRRVLQTMAEFGLKQHENGLEVYVMCEIPSNVLLAEEFAEIFDGFSIGSNDLTQLALGLDRDSELVAHLYDERNETVKRLVRHVISVARRKGRKIGICGQAPSDFPEFAEFLVECGIDSISLNPDTVIKTRLLIAQTESNLAKRTEPVLVGGS